MSCKSAVYAANSVAQNISANSVVDFGSVVRRFGCSCNLSGGNAVVKGAGYYDVTVKLNVLGTTNTNAPVSFGIYNNGTLVPGTATTITAIEDVLYSVTIPALIRMYCDCVDTLTVVVTDGEATVNNASILVEKL